MKLYALFMLRRFPRNTVFAALIIISAIALYNWLVAPHRTCLYAAQRYESVIKKVAQKNKELCRSVEQRKEQLKKLQKDFSKLHKLVLITDNTEKFAGNLQAISEQTGCRVSLLNIIANKKSKGSKKQNKAGISVNTLEINIVGGFRNITGFVEQLQSYPGKVWIDAIKIEPLDEQSSQLRCNVKITVYSINNKEKGLDE